MEECIPVSCVEQFADDQVRMLGYRSSQLVESMNSANRPIRSNSCIFNLIYDLYHAERERYVLSKMKTTKLDNKLLTKAAEETLAAYSAASENLMAIEKYRNGNSVEFEVSTSKTICNPK